MANEVTDHKRREQRHELKVVLHSISVYWH